MGNGTTIVLGVPIPSTSPIFLAFIGVHVPAGLVCVVAGIIAMLSRKGPGRHAIAGKVYFWSLSAVFVSMTALSIVRWAEDYYLFVLGALALTSATAGRLAQRRWKPAKLRVHLIAMGTSYILLLMAFYVDNGKNLPIWRNLPPWSYWVLPSAIGVPLIVRTLMRHPLLASVRSSRSQA
jgi:uncharacterized membrane protein